MKMRTVYLKVQKMEEAVVFWTSLFQMPPHKKSPFWSEFRCDNINMGLLREDELESTISNCLPVFELKSTDLNETKDRALRAGAKIVVDIADHPDKKSYVLKDPFGNEFELTHFHD